MPKSTSLILWRMQKRRINASSKNVGYKVICPYCEDTFEKSKAHLVYCSSSCRIGYQMVMDYHDRLDPGLKGLLRERELDIKKAKKKRTDPLSSSEMKCVFSSYIGSKVQVSKGVRGIYELSGVCDKGVVLLTNRGRLKVYPFSSCKMMLRDLSTLTIDECVDIEILLGFQEATGKKIKKEILAWRWSRKYEAVAFLIRKGFNIPWHFKLKYFRNRMTPVEMGLAESEQKSAKKAKSGPTGTLKSNKAKK